MKISGEAINTIYVFLLILVIADICITRAEHVERTNLTNQQISLLDKDIEVRKAHIVALEKVEIEQKYSNNLLEYYILIHKDEK